MAALLEQENGTVPAVILKAGVDPRDVAKRVNEAIGQLPRLSGPNADNAPGHGCAAADAPASAAVKAKRKNSVMTLCRSSICCLR